MCGKQQRYYKPWGAACNNVVLGQLASKKMMLSQNKNFANHTW